MRCTTRAAESPLESLSVGRLEQRELEQQLHTHGEVREGLHVCGHGCYTSARGASCETMAQAVLCPTKGDCISYTHKEQI